MAERLSDLSAFYLKEPDPGTYAMIIGYDGSILVGDQSRDELRESFAQGNRTHNELPTIDIEE